MNDQLDPEIILTIYGKNDMHRDVSFLIDTGARVEMTLPSADIIGLNLERSVMEDVEDPSGEFVATETYEGASLEWFGVRREVTVFRDERTALIGSGLMAGCGLALTFTPGAIAIIHQSGSKHR